MPQMINTKTNNSKLTNKYKTKINNNNNYHLS
jgi:hypothetical protein